MLPLHVLKQSGTQSQMMVDLKNGESYDGILESCDTFMNMKLSAVTITSAAGIFSKCEECFIRGNNVKTIQFQPEVLEKHQVQVKKRQAEALESRQNKKREIKEEWKESQRGARGGYRGVERGGRGGRGFDQRRGSSERGRGFGERGGRSSYHGTFGRGR